MLSFEELKAAVTKLGLSGAWYMASPYTNYPGGMWKAYAAATDAAERLMSADIPVFAPISYSHPIAMSMRSEKPHKWWLDFDKHFMDAAPGMIYCMLPSHEASKGMQWEVGEFQKAGKPILYWSMQ